MTKLRRFGATPVAEGVRLEVGKFTVFAVRNEARDIAVRVRREPRRLLRLCMRVPLLRGTVRLLRDVVRFFDGLGESAELEPQKCVRGTKPEQLIAHMLHIRPQTIVTLVSALMLIPLALICLYAFPMGLQLFLQRHFPLRRLPLSMIVALARVVGLLTCVGLSCRLRVFKRLCMYKGAVNKVINCYENREEVVPDNVEQYPIYARRSEPAFLLCTLCVALLLFPLIRPRQVMLDALMRVGVVLLVAALVNEPLRALEEARPGFVIDALRTPLYLLQHLTTLEPHPQMLEVAICAFNVAMGKARGDIEAEVEAQAEAEFAAEMEAEAAENEDAVDTGVSMEVGSGE